jgi:DNA-binding Lrp family transcriptional regulator
LENILLDQRPLAEISAVDEDTSVVKQKRSAFVFITAQCNECQEAFEDIRKLDSVDEVYLARGAYDIIARISGESLEFLREEVLRQIRHISSIKSTLTLTVI